jgi:eukaryotic translation initiation factor 2C
LLTVFLPQGKFGISVPQNLIKVTGRVLPEPKVLYRQLRPVEVRAGSWNMTEAQFHTGSSLKRWSYLIVDESGSPDKYSPEGLVGVINAFRKVLERRGIAVVNYLPGRKVRLTGPDDPELQNWMEKAAANVDLLLVILPSANSPTYYRVKCLGDVALGVHTICVVGDKLVKPQGQDQYFSNVALKFNLKLGGRNQLVDPARLGIIGEGKTMVVGIDVTHPSPGSSGSAPSVAGMVASVDKFVSQWPGVLRVQSEARREMVSSVKDMLKSRLRLWKEMGRHAALPENILVYRDGVSEGQYDHVVDVELPLLREACQEMYPPADTKRGLPRFTIVIVSKRHHTRFYPSEAKNADRGSNNPAGTVVDRGVTEAGAWDFYLQAHTAIQGTARPAHYFVVLDDIFRARYGKGPLPPGCKNVADVLEGLSQAMCYTYGRATKVVSICAPVYYADILCERARVYLRDLFDATPAGSAAGSVAAGAGGGTVENGQVETHERLRNTMFYV